MDTPKLITLFDLLSKGHTPAQLATTIETHGVYGWDRFDRYGAFKKTDAGASLALDALAKYVEHSHNFYERLHAEQEGYPDEPVYGSPLEAIDGLNAVSVHWFGWPEDKIPPIDKAIWTPKPSARKRPRSVANEDLVLLGALLWAIAQTNRNFPKDWFPDEKSPFTEERLIAKMTTLFPDVTYVSKTTAQNKFADAKALVKEYQ